MFNLAAAHFSEMNPEVCTLNGQIFRWPWGLEAKVRRLKRRGPSTLFSRLLIYDTITMTPTKMNTSESSTGTGRTRKSSTQRQSPRTPKPFKQRKIPKTLHGVASNISLREFIKFLTSPIACRNLRSQVGRFHEWPQRYASHVPRTCL